MQLTVHVDRFSNPSSFDPITAIPLRLYPRKISSKSGAKRESREVYWQSSRPLALGLTQTCQLLRRELLPIFLRSIPHCTNITNLDFSDCIYGLRDTLEGYGHRDIVCEIDSGSHDYLGALDPLYFVSKFPGRLFDFRIRARTTRVPKPRAKVQPQWVWEYFIIPSGTRLVFRMELPYCEIILEFKVLAFEPSLEPGITNPFPGSHELLTWAKEVDLFDNYGHSYYVLGQTRVSAQPED